MKLRYISLILLALGLLPASAAINLANFAKSSKLASGNWVKIGVDQSGVYEISYETLRQMGFSNPENVSLLGRGGAQCSTNFMTANNKPNFYDDLQSVPLLHKNNKIYFYGAGTQETTLYISSRYDAGGYFSRKSNNIYSNLGFYFLTDSVDPTPMPAGAAYNPTESVAEATAGLGLMLCEEDLVQNNSNSGQLFYGRMLTPGNPREEWPVYLPRAVPEAKGVMECYAYFERKLSANFSYGFNGTSDFSINPVADAPSSNFKVQPNYMKEMTVPGPLSTVFTAFESLDGVYPDISNIDYWTLSYQKNIPDLKAADASRMAQDFIAFPKIGYNSTRMIRMPGGADFMVFDVTDPQAPIYLPVTPDGADGLAKVTNRESAPRLMVFDPSLPQLQIKGFEAGFKAVANQNLHAAAAEGADLIIICTPDLRQGAEELAEIHRQKENLKVLIATTDECYNEFSSGVPDPMAYRLLVKMVYTSPNPCKNLLLMGPLYADFRGIVNEKNPLEGIIAYQANPMNMDHGAANANEFLGVMTDYFDETKLSVSTIDVGVGILPVRTLEEARTVAKKVEDFLNIDNFEYYLNMMTNIGGVGDNHTHDSQAIEIGTHIGKMESKATVLTPLIIDAYGFKAAQSKFFSQLNEGTMIVNYFGHGSTLTLNQHGDFFVAADVYRLRNRFLPFMAFAGCDLTNTDRGVRGLGEMLVTSTPYGMLGTMLATRQTWSGQNMDFFRSFYTRLFCNGKDDTTGRLERPLTLGEVFARTKTLSTYDNELHYQLLCDPAITLPVMTRTTVFDAPADTQYPQAVPGEYMEVSGFVPTHDDPDAVDTSYQGNAVIRLMQPFETITSEDICSKQYGETPSTLKFTTADKMYTMTAAEVKNGRFSARILVPSAAADYDGRLIRMHIATYSKDSKIASGNMTAVEIKTKAGATTLDNDRQAPRSNFSNTIPSR